MSEPTTADVQLSADLAGAADVPEASYPQTVIVTGETGALSSWMALPQGGQIWIAYEYGDRPAQRIYLWRQGGQTQPINLGWNNFLVNAHDAIVWTLSSPSNAIKIAWQYQ